MAIKATQLVAAGVEAGLLTPEQLTAITLRARRERIDLLELACLVGELPPSAFHQALAQRKNLPFFGPDGFDLIESAMKKLPAHLLQRGLVAPVSGKQGEWLITADPDDRATMEMAYRLIGARLPVAMAEPETISSAVNRWMLAGQGTAHAAAIAALPSESDDFVALLDSIFRRAFFARASDIHIEAERDGYRVRYRVDGRLQDSPRRLSLTEGMGIVSRIKVLAGMDIAESRSSQDGAMTYPVIAGTAVSVRVASLPTIHDERLTLRLMADEHSTLSLTRLGMTEGMLTQFRQTIRQSHGIILITGPTGSGKSTTLYAALGEIIHAEVNVLTVEDPVERPLVGASQVQVGGKTDFAGALRAFLRHDPDVIMVGEVRDLDTAETAFKASITGHLVFSTLHTNSAPAAITRLADLGLPRFMIAASLRAVIAQRLVRQLCSRCRRPREASAQEKDWLQLNDGAHLWEPVGCPACAGTGYRGRVGLFESLWIDEGISEKITQGASEQSLRSMAKDFISLWRDGRHKVIDGVTTLAELVRVANVEELV